MKYRLVYLKLHFKIAKYVSANVQRAGPNVGAGPRTLVLGTPALECCM